MLKKSKQDIAAHAASAASGAAYNSLNSNLSWGQFLIGDKDLKIAIQNAINQAIYEAIRVTLEEVYTQEEFEEDIGLK